MKKFSPVCHPNNPMSCNCSVDLFRTHYQPGPITECFGNKAMRHCRNCEANYQHQRRWRLALHHTYASCLISALDLVATQNIEVSCDDMYQCQFPEITNKRCDLIGHLFLIDICVKFIDISSYRWNPFGTCRGI